jgi:hypothetical protein
VLGVINELSEAGSRHEHLSKLQILCFKRYSSDSIGKYHWYTPQKPQPEMKKVLRAHATGLNEQVMSDWLT